MDDKSNDKLPETAEEAKAQFKALTQGEIKTFEELKKEIEKSREESKKKLKRVEELKKDKEKSREESMKELERVIDRNKKNTQKSPKSKLMKFFITILIIIVICATIWAIVSIYTLSENIGDINLVEDLMQEYDLSRENVIHAYEENNPSKLEDYYNLRSARTGL